MKYIKRPKWPKSGIGSKMLKAVVFCFLALTGRYLVADAKVSPDNGELNNAAGVVVNLVTKDLLNRQLQDVNVKVSLTNVKLTEFKKPSTDIRFQEATGITLALYGVSVKVDADWSFERSVTGVTVRDDGSLTASTKASVKVNVRLGSNNAGQLSVTCSTAMSEFNVRNKGTVTDSIYNLLISAFKSEVKANLEAVICQSAVNTVNANGVKELFTKYLSG